MGCVVEGCGGGVQELGVFGGGYSWCLSIIGCDVGCVVVVVRGFVSMIGQLCRCLMFGGCGEGCGGWGVGECLFGVEGFVCWLGDL